MSNVVDLAKYRRSKMKEEDKTELDIKRLDNLKNLIKNMNRSEDIQESAARLQRSIDRINKLMKELEKPYDSNNGNAD